jgi:hypothetical protein
LRRRALKAGSIGFGGGAIDCTVRNISDVGATLEVVTPLFIPDRFKLIIQSDGLNRPCQSFGAKNGAWGLHLIEARIGGADLSSRRAASLDSVRKPSFSR